jgi:hypothetical protein
VELAAGSDAATFASRGHASGLWHWAVLVVVAVSTVLLIVRAPRHSPFAVALVIIGTAAAGAVGVLERKSPRLGVRTIVCAIALLFLVAIAHVPSTSNDLWSYSMYGRIVEVHDANPYVSVPSQFPTDPFLHRVSRIWRHRGSVFGPLWVAYEAGESAIADESALASRLVYQVTAAGAAAAALVLVWHRTGSSAALAWLGLQPVLAVAVNGGHNDIIIGLGVLVSVLLMERRKPGRAGFVLGVAGLIKLTALLGVVGLVLVALHRRRPKAAAAVALAAGATVVVGYLPFAANASGVLAKADRTVTQGSPWNGLADLVVGHNAGRELLHPLAPNASLTTFFYLSALLIVGLALALGSLLARRGEALGQVAGTTTAAYPIGAEYAQPWYALWALPVLTTSDPTPIAWVAWIQATVMLAALKLPLHPTGSLADLLVRGLLTDVAPVALVIAFVAAALHQVRRARVRALAT